MTTRVSRLQPRSRSTHAALLESARGLFAQKGYEAVSLAEIAAAAAVSKATVLAHFPDKPSILAAFLSETLSEAARRVLGAGQTDVAGLAGALWPAFSHIVSDRALVRLVTADCGEAAFGGLEPGLTALRIALDGFCSRAGCADPALAGRMLQAALLQAAIETRCSIEGREVAPQPPRQMLEDMLGFVLGQGLQASRREP